MALTAAQQHEIYKIAVGLYDAAPGTVYMNELGTLLSTGTTVPALYNLLANTPSFQNQDFDYGTASTNQQFATQFVETLVGDTATQTDKDWASDYLTALLNAGSTRGAVMKVAIDALDGMSESDSIWGAAAAQFHNKLEVATFYTEEMNGHSTDIAALQGVLSGVTDDDATVLAAEDQIVQTASTFVLTDMSVTGVPDQIFGTAGPDSILGLTDTLDPGDLINGGNGNDTLRLILDDGNYVATTVLNVENVNLRPLGSSGSVTIDMGDFDTAVQNINVDRSNMNVTFESVQSLVDLSVNDSSHGISIDFDSAVATGTDDTFNVSMSDFNGYLYVDSGDNVIENVAIDATGSNSVTLDAGNAVGLITLTGGGSNFLYINDAADSVSIDASGATGDNTFDLNIQLSDGDTVIGGSGADVLSGTVTDDTSGMAPTLTGVETVSLFFSSSGSNTLDFSLANADGVETVVIDGPWWTENTINILDADSTLTEVDVSGNAYLYGSHDLSVAYSNTATATADLTIAFTGDAEIDDLTVSGAATLGLTVEDSSSVTIDDLDTTAATVNATLGDNSALDLSITSTLTSADAGATLDDLSVGNINISAGDTADITLDVIYYGWDDQTLGNLTIGDVSISAGDDSSIDFTVTASVDTSATIGDLTVGAISITAGNTADVSVSISHTGDETSHVGTTTVGDVTVAVGDSSSVDVSITAEVSSGTTTEHSTLGDMTVGNITVTAGNTADVSVTVSYTGDDSSDLGALTVGDVSVTVGDTSSVSISITASVSDTSTLGNMTVGNITAAAGASADIDVDVYYYGDTSSTLGDLTVGNVTVTAGDTSSVSLSITASLSGNGASLGDVTVGDITGSVGADSWLYLRVYDAAYSTTSDLGALTVGNVTATLGDGSSSTIDLNHFGSATNGTFGDMTVGDIALTLNNHDYINVYVSNSNTDAATGSNLTVGDITVAATSTATGDATSDIYVNVSNSASSGSGGDLTVGDITLDLSRTDVVSGTLNVTVNITNYASTSVGNLTVGNINIDADLGVTVDVSISNDGTSDGNLTVGDITLAGSGTIDITFAAGTGNNDSVGAVDSTGLLADLSLDLSIFDNGATIHLGGGDDTVIATAGDDVVTGGTGSDVLTGNGGDDTFVFAQGDSSRGVSDGGVGAVNIDVITDFNGTNDVLDLFDAGNAFNFTDGGTYGDYNAFLAAADAGLDGTHRFFFGDNGAGVGWLAESFNSATGVADEVIQLTGVAAMSFDMIV